MRWKTEFYQPLQIRVCTTSPSHRPVSDTSKHHFCSIVLFHHSPRINYQFSHPISQRSSRSLTVWICRLNYADNYMYSAIFKVRMCFSHLRVIGSGRFLPGTPEISPVWFFVYCKNVVSKYYRMFREKRSLITSERIVDNNSKADALYDVQPAAVSFVSAKKNISPPSSVPISFRFRTVEKEN